MHKIFISVIFVFTTSIFVGCSTDSSTNKEPRVISKNADAELFLPILELPEFVTKKGAIESIGKNWDDSFSAMTLETFRFTGETGLLDILAQKTNQDFGRDNAAWQQWLWDNEEMKNPGYAYFKSQLYKEIDPKFETYFLGRNDHVRIRLDEVQWGGVVQDGIPPLRSPKMLSASEATYLDDGDIVFGIEVNGDIRAYPKRILAWHEMFVDTVGDVPVAGVYCTLCGTVVLYETTLEGTEYALGTSGFLYRSNKLMYDQETQSLWNTLTGEPVIGPLIDQGIALKHRSVVTTTWGEWKKRHPDTQVLSLDTGFNRNYGEGIAYQEYFATDSLMFQTPFEDTRLENKQEVLALRFPAQPGEQLAIDTKFLEENTVYTDQISQQRILVVTDTTGANRVYDPGDTTFSSYDGESSVIDIDGNIWTLTESALTKSDGQVITSLPYHRAFWFGWRAAYPETRLVQ